MSTIPYKQLKDENGDSFYPVCGASSFSDAVPVTKGGTGADNAADARANLEAITGLGAIATGQTFPFTAPADGVIYFRFSATTSSSPSYLYLKCTATGFNTNIFQAVSSGGAAIVNSVVVKKGWQIGVDYNSNANFSELRFVPFV